MLITNAPASTPNGYQYGVYGGSDLFAIGQTYPHPSHIARIRGYRENRKLLAGRHYEVFERQNNRLSKTQRDIVYLSVNLPGLICKKERRFPVWRVRAVFERHEVRFARTKGAGAAGHRQPPEHHELRIGAGRCVSR